MSLARKWTEETQREAKLLSVTGGRTWSLRITTKVPAASAEATRQSMPARTMETLKPSAVLECRCASASASAAPLAPNSTAGRMTHTTPARLSTSAITSSHVQDSRSTWDVCTTTPPWFVSGRWLGVWMCARFGAAVPRMLAPR